jgi:hypothetical protein
MVRHIETAVRAEVTDNKLSSTAVVADLITPPVASQSHESGWTAVSLRTP